MLLSKYHECFPQKTYKITSDDQPWITHKIKTMDRKRKREYSKHRKSDKWLLLNRNFKESVKSAKSNFYKKMVSDVMSKNTSQWYSCVKRMTSHDQEKFKNINIQEISDLSDQEQAEKLGEFFSKIPNEYDQIKNEDIKIPPIKDSEIPQSKPVQVWMILTQLKTNKSTVPGDIPAKLYKVFAAHISEPLCHVFNTSLLQGEYPRIYKFESCTPVPKKYPVIKMENMRNIAGLLTADKVLEKLLSELIISDMKDKADVAQFGNQKETSIQHYLIKMIHKIMFALDNNEKRNIFAVIANMIDWNSAFMRQCPKLGIQSFQKNGVRNSLIPLLVSYFQERHQSIKWRGINSSPRIVNGGGPQGPTLGILEYLSQSNNSADCVGPDERYKFVDDLTVLEIVNLLKIGISSFNIKNQVPNDIPQHNQYTPPENLMSQKYIDSISKWTTDQKMKINSEKTKTMLFNYTNNYQFTTRLKLNDQVLETVNETKLLGTIITSDLKWDKNTNNIIKKSYAKMELIRKLSGFGAPISDLKTIYLTYIRSQCEQSINVWHSGLTNQNEIDLERVQKVAFKIILKEKYINYENALNYLDLPTLKERRAQLCLSFARKCLGNNKMKGLFPPNNRTHTMNPRKIEPYQVLKVNTERFKNSPIIFMQNLLNTEAQRKIAQDKLWNRCLYTLSSVNFSLHYCVFAASITEINPLLLLLL